jgi:hypothetical protein
MGINRDGKIHQHALVDPPRRTRPRRNRLTYRVRLEIETEVARLGTLDGDFLCGWLGDHVFCRFTSGGRRQTVFAADWQLLVHKLQQGKAP